MSLLDMIRKEEDIDKKLRLLRIAANSCKKCNLYLQRKNIVLADGSIPNKIAFIGEAPGRSEDEQGKPFVGKSGELLNRLLLIAGLKRKDITIFNTVCCRPPNNRTPGLNEMAACDGIFVEQLKLVSPDLIVTLGSMALKKFDPDGKITEVHGKPFWLEGKTIFPTFHPAAALRDRIYTRLICQDFVRLKSLLEWRRSSEYSSLVSVLYPYIGEKVCTPKGEGKLLQVFDNRVTVALEDGTDKVTFFKPAEIKITGRQVSWWS